MNLSFYQDVVGLHIVRDMRGQGPMNIVFLSDSASKVCIELIENKDHAYQGTGLSIGFSVDDLDQKAADLKQHRIVPGPVINPNPHTSFFFIQDPNGVEVQFIEKN